MKTMDNETYDLGKKAIQFLLDNVNPELEEDYFSMQLLIVLIKIIAQCYLYLREEKNLNKIKDNEHIYVDTKKMFSKIF